MFAPECLYLNGRFCTLDPERPTATALAVAGERIAAVGDDDEVRALAGPETASFDLGGRTVVPGLVDAHCHLVSHGMICQREADLRGAGSIAAIQERLRAHAARIRIREGTWILGRAFDQDRLADRRWPSRADLEAVSDSIPVRITRVCGHALVANRAAIRAAGLAEEDAADAPAQGVYTEEAMAPFHRAIPPPGPAEWRAAAAWACAAAARTGFTNV